MTKVTLTNQYGRPDDLRTGLTATIDGTADFQNTYTYDSADRMESITQTSQSGGDAVASKAVTFTYDADSRLQTLTRSVPLLGTSSASTVATSTYGVASQGDVTSLTHALAGGSRIAYTWTYDADGQLTDSTSPDGAAHCTYDSDGQLTAATYSGGSQPNESYSYDSNGNRTNSGDVTGANNEILSDGTYTYKYDADGNRIERTDIATGAVTDYTWDNRDRLTQVTSRSNEGARSPRPSRIPTT